MDVYGGSNWGLLRYDAMDYLINFIEQNPGYMKRLRYCYCTDELWMQTILATSGCKMRNEHITYIDWLKGPESPRTLRIDDYENIINTTCPFARKFDIDIDKEIIYKILERRNSTI